jgi:hypothetical protein
MKTAPCHTRSVAPTATPAATPRPGRGPHGAKRREEDDEEGERLEHVMVRVAVAAPLERSRQHGVREPGDERAPPAEEAPCEENEKRHVERAEHGGQEGGDLERVFHADGGSVKSSRRAPHEEIQGGRPDQMPPSGWFRYGSWTGTRGNRRPSGAKRRRCP